MIGSFSKRKIVGQPDPKIFGGKGAGLMMLAGAGLPVPPGFILSTEWFHSYTNTGQLPGPEVLSEYVSELEILVNKKWGDRNNPLFLAVRSGAEVFMPGMMETIHYVGLNSQTITALPPHLQVSCQQRLESKMGSIGQDFPEEPLVQLQKAIAKIFYSWSNERAATYRTMNGIPDTLGTACVIQVMVFGDWDDASGSGVVFTHDPKTGEKIITGEFLHKLPGDDLASGNSTPYPLDNLQAVAPQAYSDLLTHVVPFAEKMLGDMCELEITVESDVLWVLQCMPAPRSPHTAVRVAVDLVQRGIIDPNVAIKRMRPGDLSRLSLSEIVDSDITPDGLGIPASAGTVCAEVVFHPSQVQSFPNAILLRNAPDADDIRVLDKITGLLTAKGGSGSHFAVVARKQGIPAIVGCQGLVVSEGSASLNGRSITVGQRITICGSSGRIFLQELALKKGEVPTELQTLLSFCKEVTDVKIQVFADSLEEVKRCTDGGLKVAVSTERALGGADIDMLVTCLDPQLEEDQSTAIAQLADHQTEWFTRLFGEVRQGEVIVRLFDPPLHEFLPKGKVNYKQENPLIGHRGCRLLATHPHLYTLQIQAIFRAAAAFPQIVPHILIPMVSLIPEFTSIRALIKNIAEKEGVSHYQVGAMVETPRAALLGRKLAQEADFLAIGLMDLTQCVYGMSRDDTHFFAGYYQSNHLWDHDPFTTLDIEGVGRLIALFCADAQAAKPEIPIAITVWDEPSVRFVLPHIGKNGSIVCPSSAVSTVKMAAAQATIDNITQGG